ncbi:MAG: response regulator, partial [Alphaproteobacteria bacterium]|nr:response regulator [Alphaproteobacteria bacterium]
MVALQDLEPIRRNERMHTEFLAMVSHELRVPLTAIKGAMYSLQEGANALNRAEMREYARIASEQSDLVHGLVGDLLDVGRIESGTLSIEPEPSDLRAAIETARTALSSGGAEHAIRIEVPSDLPRVMVDRNRIAQVLANLLSNAAKQSPEGSRILVAAAHAGTHVEVSVRDEGPGFTSEQKRLLFRKFGSAGNGAGAGLGLAVSKGLVEAHGGRIWAVSPGPGLGATFSFTVPVAATAQDRADASEHAAAHGAARILVVDDDPDALRFARNALRDNGYSPLVTGDHRDIPRLLRTERPDLVLLDLVMPDADGIELLQGLPGLADLPVIILSGYGREDTIASALDAGADDYILKPCAPIELAARIRSALRRHNKDNGFRLGELVIDYGSRQVRVGGNAVSLTTVEYELLRVLSLNAGRV